MSRGEVDFWACVMVSLVGCSSSSSGSMEVTMRDHPILILTPEKL